MERRLAAIMAADVVGYSRLMQLDEEATLIAIANRGKDILDPLLAKHGGRIVKLLGDGVLVEFASALNAVRCAIDVQKAMSAANTGVPQNRHVLFRIGINVGDIISEKNDIYGDGVNIAARLESLAEPGGVVISGSVYDQVKNKSSLVFQDLGQRFVKNMSDPVRVYRVSTDFQDIKQNSSAAPALPAKPSVAVLPFENVSGDREQQYFSDGITEDLITELSRFRHLFVIARHSSFVFRAKPVEVGEIGRRLGVQYLVEGSVRRLGERIRITAQLIDTHSGVQVWADRYDQALADLFAIQDELVHTIASTLAGQVEVAAIGQLRRKPTDNLTAYDCYLRGIEYEQRFTDEGMLRAREMFERALQLDPDFSLPLPWLALNHAASWHRRGGLSDLERAFELARKAVSVDSNDSVTHSALGLIYFQKRQFERAEAHLKHAIALNPNDSQALAFLADLYACTGRAERALDCVDKAIRLNPFHTDLFSVYRAEAFYFARRYSDAAAALDRATSLSVFGHTVAAACFAMAGMEEDARAHAAQILAREPRFSSRAQISREPFKNEQDADHFLEGLLKAGLPE